MSFLTSLSGLKAAQSDLAVVSNNIANGSSTGFKKSRAQFGDLFAASPTQNTAKIAGQGVQLQGIKQQFTQGTLESTDRTLDLAVAGEGFFIVKSPNTTGSISYTRNGAFSVNNQREVVDSTGNIIQLLPVDANGDLSSNNPADMTNLVLPQTDPSDPNAVLANVSVANNGNIIATYSNGNQQALGSPAMASFVAVEGLRPIGDAHWQATGASGLAELAQAGTGQLGTIRSGSLETANIDMTEELVSLISAQRNFQANAQAIETANKMTQTIVNLQV